jgi:hypothetical protein
MYLILILFISVIFIVDTLQVFIRLASAHSGSPVMGAHLGSVIMLLNRAATASALLLIGYLVDTGTNHHSLLLVYCVASFMIALFHLFLYRSSAVSVLLVVLFKLMYSQDINFKSKNIKYSFIFFGTKFWYLLIIISCVSYVGLLLPSIFASRYFEYRAALMQTGFLINTFATVGYVVLIEKKIALVISNGNENEIDDLYNLYYRSRVVSFLIIGIISFALIFS